MSTASLRDSQLAMARFLRNPTAEPPPEGIEPRRLKIYQDLVYNNIEGFISGGFPVLRSVLDDRRWHALVAEFIQQHQCHTPYFLEISQEFLDFLINRYHPREGDLPFMAELAHYEWVELALDVSEEEAPPEREVEDPLSTCWTLSALAWVLSYQFPVQLIGPGFQPTAADQPVFLVVYRDREDAVQFMLLNNATARLLELVRESGQTSAEPLNGEQLLGQLAQELQLDYEALASFGAEQLNQFHRLGVLGC